MRLPHPARLLPILVLCLALPAVGQRGASSQERWMNALEEAEGHLAAGSWGDAEASVNQVFDEMCRRITGGESGAAFVGTALFLRAAARAGQGKEEQARWDWWTAQNLAPALRTSPLPPLGEATALLDRLRLRAPGELLPDLEPAAPGAAVRAAEPVYAPYPTVELVLGGQRVRWRDVKLRVELLVDETGRVGQPVLLPGPVPFAETPPGVVVGALSAFRHWRYRPAMRDGRPRASLVVLDRFDGEDVEAYDMARLPRLHRLQQAVVRERWQEAEAELRRNQEERDRCLTGDGICRAEEGYLWFPDRLLLGAVAAAGLGDRELAQRRLLRALNRAPSLIDLYVEAYGEAGREVAALRPRCTFGRRDRCRAVEPGSPGLEPPRAVHSPPIVPPPGSRLAFETAFPAVRLVVDEEGRVREPRLLTEGNGEVGELALDALDGWRFEPARRDGEPVAAVWEVSVPVATGRGGDRAAWRQALEDNRRRLQAAEWTRAGEEADRVAQQIAGVADNSDLIAEALLQRAVAAAGEGRLDEASWDWWSARTLLSELRHADLSSFGEAGEVLAAESLRVPSRGPDGECPAPSPGSDAALPSTVPTEGAGAMVDGELPLDPLQVEVLVAPDGRPIQPTLIAAAAPGVVRRGLEALGRWRFEASEAPAVRCFRVWVPSGPEVALRNVTKEARKLAEDALAEAKAGSAERAAVLWLHAQRRDPRLHRVDLRHHGTAGRRLLAALQSRASTTVGRRGGEVSYPVKVYTPAVQYTEEARRARVSGVVIVRTLIDREGEVEDVEVLKGLPMGLSEETARTISRWRFLPALVDGRPVPVHYNLTVSLSISR